MSRALCWSGLALAVILSVGVVGCGNSPVAIVNNERITESEFQHRMVAAVGRDILKDMIDRELIRQAAEEAGIQLDEEELAQEIERAKEGFPSEEAFQQFLTARNITEDEWIDEIRMAMTARQLTIKDVTYTEEELESFFEEHKERYALPLRVSLSEIVVASEEDAEQVMSELREDPSKFADLARVYSLSPYTKQRGGKRPEDMPVNQIGIEPIREAVTSLPVGEISDPIKVETDGGEQWYILRVDERKAEREGSFEEDKEQIIRDYQSVRAKPLQEIIKEQAEKSNVVVVDPRFQELNEIYSSVPTELPGFGVEEPEVPGTGEEAPPAGEEPVVPVVPPATGSGDSGS